MGIFPILGVFGDDSEGAGNAEGQYVFSVKMETSGAALWNVADNINVWHYSAWHEPLERAPQDYYRRRLPFVRYVQFMTAAGGNDQRDLFKAPQNRAVTNDYNFEPLIRACESVLRQGLIPHLKLGNVPLKFTKNPQISTAFGVNRRPPDDYRQWHSYIKALATALVKRFGADAVKTWRFGAVTEYENADWFSVDDDPERTLESFFKLYDYTVDALQQVIGEDVCVGAHSMTCSEGLWDEREFIMHCANGVNRATGKKGTRLCFLASSFYELEPGKTIPGNHTLPESIALLRSTAEKAGLANLFYGVDEGRILNGSDGKPLDPRAVGYTWQAAFDARLYRIAFDNNIRYFSHWGYTTNGAAEGILSVSAQISGLFYKMNGAIQLPLTCETNNCLERGKETGAIAAWHKEQNKLLLLIYAYSDSLFGKGTREVVCRIDGLGRSKSVMAVKTLVSDDSNFFDEWMADWPSLGITREQFSWSPEGFVIAPALLPSERRAYYESCARLKPVTETLRIKSGELEIRTAIPTHGVMLYEIEL